jgi:hypothetical protein
VLLDNDVMTDGEAKTSAFSYTVHHPTTKRGQKADNCAAQKDHPRGLHFVRKISI